MRSLGCFIVMSTIVMGMIPGCVPMEKWRRENGARLALEAQKEQLQDDLRDMRANYDVLKRRLESCEQGDMDRDSLISSLRRENDSLESRVRDMAALLEANAGRDLPAIQISGPVLPAQLDSALKKFAQDNPDTVVYDERTGSVKWTADILFALGSDVVKDTAKASLTQFADIVRSTAAEGFDVLVVGHTDSTPISMPATKAAHPTNWHLSAHRSISVARLMLTAGVPNNRVGVAGYSEYRPVADNSSTDGKSRNRRVEIYLVPSGTVSTVAAGG